MPGILIVEDHATFSEAIAFVLGSRLSGGLLGLATFHHATTVAEGLGLVSEKSPLDLAVVDLLLPDGDGMEVVRKIKSFWPETPVAVLSSVEDLSGALASGADEAIAKGLPLTEIVARLAGLVSGGGRTGA
ncbi:MAG TPA: response regulator [Rubrobacter sp.]|nr:response regulator [Rubrobacter sp.]